MYKHLLLPTDGSPISVKSAAAGIKLAKGYKAKVTAVYVLAPFSRRGLGEIRAAGTQALTREEYERTATKRAQAALARVERAAKAARVPCATLVAWNDDPAKGILEAARTKKCDLIVMSTSNRSGLERFFLGSVATEVLTRSPVPVQVRR